MIDLVDMLIICCAYMSPKQLLLLYTCIYFSHAFGILYLPGKYCDDDGDDATTVGTVDVCTTLLSLLLTTVLLLILEDTTTALLLLLETSKLVETDM